ncbi:MAG: metallophosphoesterase [Bradymonadaceae bacterium]
MSEAFFRWQGASDRARPHVLERPESTVHRIAHLTDPHVPSETDLVGRLLDLMREHGSIGSISKEISAISNEFGHDYSGDRARYVNLLKKTLVGLHHLDVDHLVMTGDLVHCGLAREFVDVRAALELAEWWGEDRLSVVAGNHDRFNLYSHLDDTSMEEFFPVVAPGEARIKKLGDELALLEIDTNRRPDDPHLFERWLPNTVGRIYPEVVDWVESRLNELRGRRVFVLLHHHVTDDWYEPPTGDFAGLMDPVEGIEPLLDVIDTVDPGAMFLHGHQHEVMPVGYRWRGHPFSCPGGFHVYQCLNVIDVEADGGCTVTQLTSRPR